MPAITTDSSAFPSGLRLVPDMPICQLIAQLEHPAHMRVIGHTDSDAVSDTLQARIARQVLFCSRDPGKVQAHTAQCDRVVNVCAVFDLVAHG